MKPIVHLSYVGGRAWRSRRLGSHIMLFMFTETQIRLKIGISPRNFQESILLTNSTDWMSKIVIKIGSSMLQNCSYKVLKYEINCSWQDMFMKLLTVNQFFTNRLNMIVDDFLCKNYQIHYNQLLNHAKVKWIW